MEELQNKYNELETQRINLIGTKENVQLEMDKMIKKVSENDGELGKEYYDLAEVFGKMIDEKAKIENKQLILSKAMNILEGDE